MLEAFDIRPKDKSDIQEFLNGKIEEMAAIEKRLADPSRTAFQREMDEKDLENQRSLYLIARTTISKSKFNEDVNELYAIVSRNDPSAKQESDSSRKYDELRAKTAN